MEADLRTRLLAASAVTGIVSTRISWATRPQASRLPAITLKKISPGRDYNHSGADDLKDPRVQINCWAASHLQASQLAEAVIATLEPQAEVGTTQFSNSLLDGELDFEPESLEQGSRRRARPHEPRPVAEDVVHKMVRDARLGGQLARK